MKRSLLTVSSFKELLPAVSGRIFHATSMANLDLIKKSGALVPNRKLLYTPMFGNTSTGYFRKRGCVSFFDYRCSGTAQWARMAKKCDPTRYLNRGDEMTILFLCESEYDKLIPWTAWSKDEAWSEMVVSYIEAGYKGRVSLKKISEELIVKYT